MKKILLIVGIAFGCSTVYAQNTIVQTGDGNTLNADQSQKTNPATVYSVTQYQGYNVANITQGADVNAAGQENITTLRQISIGVTALNLRNWFSVNQSGATNRIVGDQYGQNNRASVTQTVNTNSSVIQTSQSGWNNGIIVRQTGDAAGGSSIYQAIIQQGAAIPGNAYDAPNGNVGPLPTTSRNTAELTQSGHRGMAYIYQLGSSGLFRGTQRGGDITPNTLTVVQSNNAGAEVDQSGNANIINVTQQGYQYARVTQASSNPGVETEPVNSTVTILQGVGGLDDSRNSASVAQTTGDGNTATVFQNAATSERNYAKISQAGTRLGGTNSVVTVTQTGKSSMVEAVQLNGGSGNAATFTQSDSELGRGSNAKLEQSGDANSFTATQYGKTNNIGGAIASPASFATQQGRLNVANLAQDGQNNQIALGQNGANNTIGISQFNDRASGVGNRATATQGASSSRSDITITQGTVSDGDENVAVVNQTRGDLNSTIVTQYESNTATVTQSGTDDLGNTSTVVINQSASNGGTATATQADGTRGGDIVINQGAERNTATVRQTAGRQNYALVNQADDDNTATVTQSGTLDGATISSVQVLQNTGKFNVATVTQSANGSTVITTQAGGDRNETTVTQSGRLNAVTTTQSEDDNTSTVTQSGDNNVVTTAQAGVAGGDAADNMAMVTQAGTQNVATTFQLGITNEATVVQAGGRENNVGIIQVGTSNVATANQTTLGRQNIIFIAQGAVGDPQVEENEATVNQTAGESQVAIVIQTGDNETITINQANTNNAAASLQAGEFDEATITQNGSFGIAAIAQFGTDGQSGNDITATQSGSYNAFAVAQGYHDNTVTISQSGSENGLNGNGTITGGIIAAQYGQRNNIDVDQNANSSFVGIAQGNIAPTGWGLQILPPPLIGFTQVFDNSATVTQVGRQNIALIGQQGDRGTAGINQAGENNTVGIIQLNVGLTTAFSLPNTATATQAELASNSGILLAQRGRGNVATATQLAGRLNTIALQQDLDQNTATLEQRGGNDNVIEATQGTDPGRVGHTLTITQGVGERTSAIVAQSGYENSLTLTQNGDDLYVGAGQAGHNNTATLSQTGQLHIINLGQGGMNNVATITQTN